MHARNTCRAAAVAVAMLTSTLGSVATAHADAPANGCPNGFTLMAVADLAPQGYQVPGMVDDPSSGLKSFGQPGNHDGLICARKLGNQTTTWGGQLYDFTDNSLPA